MTREAGKLKIKVVSERQMDDDLKRFEEKENQDTVFTPVNCLEEKKRWYGSQEVIFYFLINLII